MLIRYPDGSASWRCERCGHFHVSRFVLMAKTNICPPWGWSGDFNLTYCDRCVAVTQLDAKGLPGPAVTEVSS